MNSLTAKIVAFALPAIGLLISQQTSFGPKIEGPHLAPIAEFESIGTSSASAHVSRLPSDVDSPRGSKLNGATGFNIPQLMPDFAFLVAENGPATLKRLPRVTKQVDSDEAKSLTPRRASVTRLPTDSPGDTTFTTPNSPPLKQKVASISAGSKNRVDRPANPVKAPDPAKKELSKNLTPNDVAHLDAAKSTSTITEENVSPPPSSRIRSVLSAPVSTGTSTHQPVEAATVKQTPKLPTPDEAEPSVDNLLKGLTPLYERAPVQGSSSQELAPEPVFNSPEPKPASDIAPIKRRATDEWSPVDIRTVRVDTAQSPGRQIVAKQATHADKLQAQKAVQLGFELVQRRAHYSARARFIQALRIVSRSLDDQCHTTKHSVALRNALAAYDESSDFYPKSARPDDDVNLYAVVCGHNTSVLENAEPQTLTPRQCIREYMAFAEQEFSRALGNEAFGSQALYGLGRLEAAQETTSTTSTQVRANRSLMLYQTALIIDEKNFAAANELGVLLARFGNYENAIDALRHCVSRSPETTAWKNLSNIYRRMGRTAEAQMAEVEAQRTLAARRSTPFVATQPRVEWVDADTFARMNTEANLQLVQKQAQQPPPAVKPQKTAIKSRIWPFGRK